MTTVLFCERHGKAFGIGAVCPGCVAPVTSVLVPPAGPPSTTGMLPIELDGARSCMCGHLLIPARVDGVRWYWQRHSVDVCTLELPDLVCWCGLKRSEHIDGHDRTKAAP